jgi:hypothetical protein
MNTHHNGFLLLPIFYILCLLGLSIQPLYACPWEELKKGPIALVIANSKYEHVTLRQPINDAKAMRDVLEKIGFNVLFKQEVDERTMNNITRGFSNCLKNSQDVGLFYFTGYGVQVEGKNYLLPVNANIRDKADVKFDAFPVGKLLERLQYAKNSLNIIILDASRDNSILNFKERGLTNISAPSGFIIAYPAAAGKTIQDKRWARNSLYISTLVKTLETAGQNHERVDDVFMKVPSIVIRESQGQQQPISYISLKEKFCFGGCKINSHTTVKPSKQLPPVEPKPLPENVVKLVVRSNVNGATVYIDEKPKGHFQNKKLIVRLSLGVHTVKVKKDGYSAVPKQQVIVVYGGRGETHRVRFRLKRHR